MADEREDADIVLCLKFYIHFDRQLCSFDFMDSNLCCDTKWMSGFDMAPPASAMLTSAAERIQNLPRLLEDIVQTSINTGPRGALRLAQGVQAVAGVGSEWLTDVSKWTNTSAGLPPELQLGLLSPLYPRKLVERLGATLHYHIQRLNFW
ncbi:uncharacterized aarF domain-containing protein kinase At5g05200, chloroplastic-like isoform X3 [Spinacia oleracea]|uniref:Uncharacterized aarF domain-containing protein kinase At5g05200, chloroplastic-like isoform X3 n=1 Tax=Spinacia oleracea TaxID=3562 RepID=A0A9R0IE83_SPIOL|nr:uncharacterized aarF domain-containing protein kinase At5g05200, chloroplastic-like isoform X3 [Spinacia oleracea]XP_021846514.2 uncharacterized aarF domain-containing protein kinase At5g05200, chloroplastic-like isoform X3 [Spinacia oleracea]